MNEWYNNTGYPLNSEEGSSGEARAEFQALQAAFDKMPVLLGNDLKLLMVQQGGLGITVIPIGSYQMSVPWTPVLSCGTPGDLAVTYAKATGLLHRFGQLTLITWELQTSAFTWTTSSGGVFISGVPVIATSLHPQVGALEWSGITKANYTQINPELGVSATTINFVAAGSAHASAALTIADLPTGGNIILKGSIVYLGE